MPRRSRHPKRGSSRRRSWCPDPHRRLLWATGRLLWKWIDSLEIQWFIMVYQHFHHEKLLFWWKCHWLLCWCSSCRLLSDSKSSSFLGTYINHTCLFHFLFLIIVSCPWWPIPASRFVRRRRLESFWQTDRARILPWFANFIVANFHHFVVLLLQVRLDIIY